MKLNGGPARDYAEIVSDAKFDSPQESIRLSAIEKSLDGIHNSWMRNNDWQKNESPQLFKPYSQLTPDEQIKDLDVLESALRARETPLSKRERQSLSEYREELEHRINLTSPNPEVITEANIFDYISNSFRDRLNRSPRFKKSLSEFIKDSSSVDKDAFLTSLRKIDQIESRRVQQRWLDKMKKSLNRCVGN